MRSKSNDQKVLVVSSFFLGIPSMSLNRYMGIIPYPYCINHIVPHAQRRQFSKTHSTAGLTVSVPSSGSGSEARIHPTRDKSSGSLISVTCLEERGEEAF